MNEQKILTSLNRSIQQAPIDLLENLKNAQVIKQPTHDHITQQEEFTHTSPNSFTKRLNHKPTLISYLSAAAALILVVSSLLIQFQARALQTIVYLDINPSIAITLNANEKIIALHAQNDDGERILSDLTYRGKTLEFLTLEIIHRLTTESYLMSDQDVLLVSVYSPNQARASAQIERMDALLKETLERTKLDPVVILQTMQPSGTIEQLAKTYQLSESRLHFIGLLMRFNPNLKLEDLVVLSLQELLAIAQDQKFDLSPILTPQILENMTAPPSSQPSQTPEVTTSQSRPTAPAQTETTGTSATTTTTSPLQQTLITMDQAIAIALNYVQGQIIKIEFDDDEDTPEYDIDIHYNGLIYELEIDARTGAIIEVEVNDDDDDDDDDEDEDDDD